MNLNTSHNTLQAIALAIIILTATLAVITSLSATVQAQTNNQSIQVDVDPSDLPGDGTESNPYEISNISELQAMEDDLDANYELVSDIDASQTAQFNNGSGFDPVGNSSDKFNGSIEGSNHTVTGFTINRPKSQVGLFGVTGDGAIITNITLASVTLTGVEDVGGLVGKNDGGTIRNVVVSGKVSENDFDTTEPVGVTDTIASSERNQPDRSAPTIEDITILNETVAEGDPLVATVTVSDATGVEDISLDFQGVNTDSQSLYLDRPYPTSQNTSNGTYRLTWNQTVPQDTYRLDSVRVRDTLDNYNSIYPDGFSNPSFIPSDLTVTVEGPDDRSAPAIEDITILNETVSAGDPLVATVTVSDATGVEDISLDFQGVNTDSQSLYLDRPYPTSQNTSTGTYRLTWNQTVPQDTYRLDSVRVRDTLDNYNSIYPDGFSNPSFVPSDLTVTVEGPDDRSAPTIEDITILNETVAEDDPLVATVTVSDATGVEDISLDFQGVNADSQSLYLDRPYPTSRNTSNGTYRLTWNQTAPQDTYRLDSVRVRDTLDNYNSIYPDGFSNPSFVPSDLTVELTSESEVQPTSVTMSNQTVSNGSTTVTVDSVQFSDQFASNEEFVIVVHETTSSSYGTEIGPKVGESGVISPESDSQQDIPVNLSTTLGSTDSLTELTNSRSLVAMLHRANTTDADGLNHGDHITRDGAKVTDRAQITVSSPQVDVDPSDLPGDGTSTDPYEISNVSELQAMEDDLDANYELVSDIDASQTAQFNNASGFDPIGLTSTTFSGSFTGNGHTVTGLTINRPDENQVGLFGVNSGSVRNITLTEMTVTGNNTVGGVIGENRGTLQNATASGNVNGSKNIGGLVGNNGLSSTVQSAISSGSVNGTENVGGLVGEHSGTIQNTKASASVTGSHSIGGLVGIVRFGSVTRSFAIGTVSGTTDTGGLVGKIPQLDDSTLGTVEYSYWDTQTTDQNNSDGTPTGLPTEQMQGELAEIKMDELAFGRVWKTQPNDYPALIAQQETNPPQTQTQPPISVTFANQTTSNGSTTITVDSAQFGNQSVPGEDFVVVVHETTQSTYGTEIGAKVGESDVLSAGNQTDITVDLATTLGSTDSLTELTNSQSLVAMLHRADTDDSDNINHGDHITRDGAKVTDRAQITVDDSEQNQPDRSAPAIEDITILNETVSTGDPLVATVTVSDATGVEYIDLDLQGVNTDSQYISLDRSYPASQNTSNGTYRLTWNRTVPQNTYRLQSVSVSDTLDNTNYTNIDGFSNPSFVPSDLTVTVEGPDDRSAPVIEDITILNETVAEDDPLVATVTVNDATGVEYIDLDLQGVNTDSQYISLDRSYPASQNTSNGTYRLTWNRTVPQDTYRLQSVSVSDTLDNTNYTNIDGFSNPSFVPSDLTVTVEGPDDRSAPVIEDITILNETVAEDDPLVATVTVNDATGVEYIDLDLQGVNADSQYISLDRSYPASQNTSNGTYRLTWNRTVPQDTYRLQSVSVSDTLDNTNYTNIGGFSNPSFVPSDLTVELTSEPEVQSTSVTMSNQTVSNGSTTVTVDSVQFSDQFASNEGFVIVVHETTGGSYGTEIGPKVGESGVISPESDSQQDIPVNLSTTLGSTDSLTELTNSQSLVAMLHRANTTDGNNINHGDHITRNGSPITSRARVTVNQSANHTSPVLSIQPSTTSVQPNGNGSVTVKMVVNQNQNQTQTQSPQPVFGAQTSLAYNTSVLDAVNVTKGTFLSADGVPTTVQVAELNETAGVVNYGEVRQTTTEGGISGSGVLFTVTFEPAQSVSRGTQSQLTLEDVILSTATGESIPIQPANATATIPLNQPPSVNATLQTAVHNVNAPIVVNATASDAETTVETVTLRNRNPANQTQPQAQQQCQTPSSSCEVELTTTPTESSWNGTGYEQLIYTIAASDTDNLTGTDTVATPIYIPGDANGDGIVNIFDSVAVGSSWKAQRGQQSYSDAGDLNNDGIINIFDAVAIGSNWQTQASVSVEPTTTTGDLSQQETGTVDAIDVGTATATATNTNANTDATLSVEPQTTTLQFQPESASTESFTVEVVATVNDSSQSVFGTQASLEYDTSVLNVTAVNSGSFLSADGVNTAVQAAEANETSGVVNYGETRTTTEGGISGSGTLFTVTFEPTQTTTATATQPTVSRLNLTDVILSTATQQSLSVQLQNGAASNRELVIQPPSQIVRGEPFAVEVFNSAGEPVSGAPVTLIPGQTSGSDNGNQTATTNASGVAVFTLPADTETEVVELAASSDGLTTYVGGAQRTVVGIRDPGDLQVENLSVNSPEVTVGNSVTVSAEITNTNQTDLTQTLTITANNTGTLLTRTVTIPGNTTQQFSLTPTFSTIDTQTLSVNGQSAGTVTVTEITPPTPELETPQLTLSSNGTDTSSSVDLPAEVNATRDANLTVPLTNRGDEPGEFTLNLTVADGDGNGDILPPRTRTRTLEVNATQTQTVTFEDVTGRLSAQPTPYAVTVTAITTTTATPESSRNTSVTTNLSIAPSDANNDDVSVDDDESLQITDTRSPARVSDGDRFTVSARIGNFGTNVTTDELSFAVDTDRDGNFSDETTRTQTQTLPANETARVAFQATASSDSDSGSGQPPLTFRLSTDADTVTGNLSVISSEFTTAVSTGDPHIVSFDGVAYDFQAAGEFVLAREPTPNGTGTGSLIVQARQEPLAGSDSITRNTAVATVVNNTTVIIDATDPTPLQINGSAVELNRSDTIAVGNGTGEITRTQDGNTLTITYPGPDDTAGIGDERLTVDLYDDRVDIALSLDPDRDRPVEGVFGPADGNATNDIGLPNGTALAQPPQAEQLYGVFRQSWRVNNSTTLFAYEDDNGPETYYDPTIPAEAVSLADLDPTTRQAAEQRAIDAGLQPGTVAFRNAVLDVALTGDGSYLTSAQQQNTTAETTTVVGAPTESTVRVEPASASASASLGPGGTTNLSLILEQAPEGLAGYNLTASVTVTASGVDSTGVRVVGATAPDIFNSSVTETTIGPDNQTVEIRATDITTVVESNATDISLGTITVAANETADVSEVPVTVSVSRIDDDSGSPIDVQTENGTVSVTEQPPLAEGLNPPTDQDNDGVFEDLNGNGRVDFNDVVILFENLPDAEVPFQDVNGNGRIDFDDIVELFKEI